MGFEFFQLVFLDGEGNGVDAQPGIHIGRIGFDIIDFQADFPKRGDEVLVQISREKSMKALSEFLRPEFINRVDAVVQFNSLTEENFKDIAGLMLTELKESMAGRGMNLTWTEQVPEWLCEKAFSPAYGARNLRRTIETEIEDKIAAAILKDYERGITQVGLYAEDGQILIRTL